MAFGTGPLRVLGRGVPSGGTIVVSITPTASRLLVKWHGVEVDTDDSDLSLLVNAIASYTNQFHTTEGTTITAADAGNTELRVHDHSAGAGIGNDTAPEADMGSCEIAAHGGGAGIQFTGEDYHLDGSADSVLSRFGGRCAAAAITSVTLQLDAGNIDDGEMIVYEMLEA